MQYILQGTKNCTQKFSSETVKGDIGCERTYDIKVDFKPLRFVKICTLVV
jgi:hypothetical protein